MPSIHPAIPSQPLPFAKRPGLLPPVRYRADCFLSCPRVGQDLGGRRACRATSDRQSVTVLRPRTGLYYLGSVPAAMPSTTTQRRLASQFVEATNASRENAQLVGLTLSLPSLPPSLSLSRPVIPYGRKDPLLSGRYQLLWTSILAPA